MLAADLRDLPEALQERIWTSPDYIAEEKFNGIRGLFHIGSTENRISTRCRSKLTGLYSEKTDHFPHLRDLPLGFLDDTVLDGELLLDMPAIFTGKTWAYGTLSCTMAICGTSPEHATQMQQQAGYTAFKVFDIIRHKGESLEKLPFWQRRVRLRDVCREITDKGIAMPHLNLVPQVSTDKRLFYEKLVAAGQEGVVLKNRNGLYRHTGRSRDMLKAKRSLTVDGFIIGATEGKHGNAGLVGSLKIGAYDAFTGRVREIAGVPPYDLSLGTKSNLRREATATQEGKPCLTSTFLNRVVELEAFCWNKNKRLVHAKIARFRDDKAPEDCILNACAIGVPS